jgi:hypothetical protein
MRVISVGMTTFARRVGGRKAPVVQEIHARKATFVPKRIYVSHVGDWGSLYVLRTYVKGGLLPMKAFVQIPLRQM